MINFEKLENLSDKYEQEYADASPFPHIVVDNFCNEKINSIVENLPNPIEHKINQSRDYVFAKNKFEKSNFRSFGPEFNEIYEDLISDRFKNFICKITGEEVFVDPEFHGGGLHQGGEGSFLDMHVDFNVHPQNNEWIRELNILLYLNKSWKKEYRGELEIEHLKARGEIKKIEPIFNRCVIMLTKNFTLHGYKKINFPKNEFRRSIATYAYTHSKNNQIEERSTQWFPEDSNPAKRLLGQYWPKLVKIKGMLFGSATKKNK
tara:strand:+ start:1034 stop:1819 length:786 start_codon:yes stop_codon:yes gene_type:complete